MATLTRSIVIDAPVETVFDTALDISKLWKVKDVALADVTLTPEGVGTSARLWTHLLGFHLEGGLRITEVARPERIVAQVDFFAEKPTWRFTFAGVDGGTEMTAQGEWESRLPVLGGSVEKMMAKEHEPFLEEMLASFKAEVESHKSAA